MNNKTIKKWPNPPKKKISQKMFFLPKLYITSFLSSKPET
jgi:hypothetical protein